MKVVHVITGLGQGGAESSLFRLISAQADPSKYCVISLTNEGLYGPRLREKGVTVIALGLTSVFLLPWRSLQLVMLLRRFGPDIVQTWMYHADLFGGLAARVAGIPVCWGIRHSNLSAQANKVSTRIVAHVCAVLSHFVPRLMVSCSRRAVAVHRDIGYANKFRVVPNGLAIGLLDTKQYDRARIREELNIPSDAFLIGHVGRSDPQKDHANLLKAFHQVASSHTKAYLLLVGKGLQSGSEYYEKLVDGRNFDQKVIALGPRDDIVSLMHAMDIFVLSSVGEAFPNVVAEAMACAVPCVVTDVGDAAHIVGDTGWVVPPSLPLELARAITKAIQETLPSRERRGAEARRRVAENFSLGRMVAGYGEVWHEALSKRQ